ncbi:MAG: CoA pyrophosphatase [Dehalococcoidia bacterium]|nr:CoA pyrophosphatase [Dehalococcoidia bacterium]MSQ17901.1 CoA pyrophosphatase [Dehalococcoidia bacterium]
MGLSTPQIIEKVLAHRSKATLADASLMPAAVMVLLYPKDGEYCVLLNKRSEQVEHHKGEISFPGGARDPEDQDFLATALREVEEEMGIHPAHVSLLGQLDDVATRSHFGVRVFTGTIPYPYPFRPSADEIAEVLEVPISLLQSPAALRQETRWVEGRGVSACTYAYNHHLIFGATAKILQQFLQLLEEGTQRYATKGMR